MLRHIDAAGIEQIYDSRTAWHKTIVARLGLLRFRLRRLKKPISQCNYRHYAEVQPTMILKSYFDGGNQADSTQYDVVTLASVSGISPPSMRC
jgi:hypothetical protein